MERPPECAKEALVVRERAPFLFSYAGECDQALARLLMLSDGVFAIALTLLALELRLPDSAQHAAGRELLGSLLQLWPKYLSFVQSFFMLSIYWIAHHRVFSYIDRCDGRLIWLTLLQLLCIVFIPFPTAVIGSHFHDPIAWQLYLGTLATTSLLLLLIWLHAALERRLLHVTVHPQIVRRGHILSVGPALASVCLVAVLIWAPATLTFVVALSYAICAGFVLLGVLDLFEPHDLRQTRPAPDSEP